MMSATVKKDTIKTPEEALIEIYRRMRPGRSADPGLLAQPVRGHVPEPAEVRLLAGGPAEAQHQAGPVARRSARRSCTRRTSPRSSRSCCKLRRNPARRGRHRPPGQPPRAQRGRAAGEPVPHRPRPHGARHQGKDERLPGDGHGHAPRPHQRQAGHGLHPRVLRVQPAQPVHGPDEPALGDHPQAAPLAPWGRAASAASAPGSRCATCTPRTTAASARSRRRKARTSASSPASPCFARINEFGFIESPYRKVKNGRVLDYYQVLEAGDSELQGRRHRRARGDGAGERRPSAAARRSAAEVEPYCFYLSAWEEDKYTIAQANIKLDDDGAHRRGPRLGAQDRQLRPGQARGGRLRRRLAQAAGLGGRLAGALPGERRRQPRADGLQHAAPGRAPAALARRRWWARAWSTSR